MRFLSGSPDVPDDLIRDVTDGNAVFLCGAGVSMRAKFPSFKQLAEQIYGHLGETPRRNAKQWEMANMIAPCRSLEKRTYLLARRLIGDP
jgi:hypothetical protein